MNERLIDANALLEKVCNGCELKLEGLCKKYGDVIGCIANEIASAPTVFASTVVWHKIPTIPLIFKIGKLVNNETGEIVAVSVRRKSDGKYGLYFFEDKCFVPCDAMGWGK